MWFTVLGAGTLGGCLLHGFLVKGADCAGLFDTYTWLSTPLGEIFLTIAVAVVVTLLCTPFVRRMFPWAMEPEMKWAFRSDPVENVRGRGQSSLTYVSVSRTLVASSSTARRPRPESEKASSRPGGRRHQQGEPEGRRPRFATAPNHPSASQESQLEDDPFRLTARAQRRLWAMSGATSSWSSGLAEGLQEVVTGVLQVAVWARRGG